MGLWKKITNRFVNTASNVVSDSVKKEAKHVAANVVPTLIGIGVVIAGFSVFRSSLVHVPKVASSILPTLTTTSVVTNNYFFDPKIQAEVLAKLLKK